MSNFKLVKTAAALALGASVVTSPLVTPDASAASKYKVKSGKLVVAKTGKVAKGYVTYNKLVYKDGKKFTGLKGKEKVYYKAGKKATGTYKGAYYVKGAKKVTTGLYKNKYYKKGALATGTYKGSYYVKGNNVVTTGLYKNKYYKKGVLATGTYKGSYYAKGIKKVTTGLYNSKYYVKGALAKGLTVFEGNLYKDGVLNKTLVLVDGKLFDGAKPNVGVKEFEGKFYNGTEIATGAVEVDGAEVIFKDGVKILAAIESATAINATELTVAVTLDKEVAEADLKDKKITLTGEQTLTATFVKVEGKVATYKVDTDIKGKASYDGEYAITSPALTGDVKTTYSAVIAGTFVEGFVFSQAIAANTTTGQKAVKAAPLANATVTVDGKKVTTDTNGYYQLAVNPGLKTVEISKGNEYFVSEGNTEVARNEASVINVDLVEVDATKLFFTGTVLDSKDSKAVVDADVQLQTKNDKGEWVNTEYTAITDGSGKFQFANNGATVVAAGKNKAADKDKNVLAVGSEYRAVVEKAINADNLDDVYKKQNVTFTVSNKKEETTKLVTAEKVAELKGLSINASSLDGTIITGDVNVKFLNTDGEEELEEFDITPGTDVELSADNKSFKEAVEVVTDKPKFINGLAGTAVKPRLVSGTYFMVVDNGTSAIKAYAVKVTEGGNATVKFEVEASKTAQAKTSVDKVQYKESLAVDPAAAKPDYAATTEALTELNAAKSRTGGKAIEASYAAYQTVEGKDIKISDSNANAVTAAFDTSGNVTSITAADAALERLAASVTYKIKSESDFLVGNKDLTVKPDAATNNVTANVNAAAKLVKINLTDKATGDNLANTEQTVNGIKDDYVTVKTLKLVNDEGKTVAEVSPNKTVAVTNTAKNGSTKGYTTLDLSKLGEETAALFTNIQADKYKLTVEVAGHKSGTSVTTDIIDFQNGEITAELDAIKGTAVTGYIRYADNGETVAVANGAAEASVIAYDEKGDAIEAANFGTGSESTFTINGLEAGKEYTFVVRGTGFETQAVKKVVTAEEVTSLNFDVVRGAKGQFKLQIVDADNAALLAGTIPSTNKYVKDSYFDKVTDSTSATPSVTAEFDGSYELTVPTAATGTEARTYLVDGVSAGAYTLTLDDTNPASTKYVLPQSYNLTLKDINGTSYATSTGVEIIKVPLVGKTVTGLNVALNLEFTGTATGNQAPSSAPTDLDYVQVINAETGAIVATQRGNTESTPENFIADKNVVNINVPNNATYTVKAFLNNGFVKTETISVQNNDVKRTINVSQTAR